LMFVFIISGFFTKKMSVHYEKEIKKRPVRYAFFVFAKFILINIKD
jgi:hypothetical protein